jgi:AcrR family transcriptional regulator
VKQPAHRPSRREDILEAATRVFATKGWTDAAISDVAEVADVAVTAVYYHFAGKDDLFGAALQRALASISDVVLTARPEPGHTDSTTLIQAIDAVWAWIDNNPYPAALVHIQLPGATRQTDAIRRDFHDLHVRRAFDYLDHPGPVEHRPSPARMGAATLAMQTLVDILMSVHAMRLEDGPLSKASPAAVRTEVHRIAQQLLVVS